MNFSIRFLLPVILWALLSVKSLAEDVPTQRVGLPLVIEDQYLPGKLLEPVPRRDREPPLVVRILETKPAKDGYRYTFEVQGLDPGRYNLGEYLRENAAETGHSAHEVPVVIVTDLPPGLPRPSELENKPVPEVGGYRTLLKVLGGVWIVGLVAFIYSFRKKKPEEVVEDAPPGLAERLKPLVEKAAAEDLSSDEQAHLERYIIGHWRKRLPEVSGLEAADALSRLRKHPEASPLILKLEEWLHAPDYEISSEEIDQLLEPYRS